MDKYDGIKSAEIIGKNTVSVNQGKINLGKLERTPRIFLVQLITCSLLLAVFILLGYIENPIMQNILKTVSDAINFDLLGTDAASCIINVWVNGLL